MSSPAIRKNSDQIRADWGLPEVLKLSQFWEEGYFTDDAGAVWFGFEQSNAWGAYVCAARIFVEADTIKLAFRGNLEGLEPPAAIQGDVPVLRAPENHNLTMTMPPELQAAGFLVKLPFKPAKLTVIDQLP